MHSDCDRLNRWNLRCNLAGSSSPINVHLIAHSTCTHVQVLIRPDLLQSLQRLRIDVLGQIGNQIETVERENAQPATLLPEHGAVGSDAEIVLTTVQEHAFHLNFLLFNDLEQVTIETKDDESAQLLNERLADDYNVSMA